MRAPILLLILLCFPILGCTSEAARLRSRSGPPDLIAERSGDEARYFRPGADLDDPWPRADRTEYYLAPRKRIVIKPGHGVRVRPLGEAEAAEVRRRLDSIDARQ